MSRIPQTRTLVSALAPALALFITAVVAAAGGPGTLSFTNLTYDVGEGAGNASLTLTRTGGTDGKVAARVTFAGGTAGAADYLLRPGEVDTTFTRHATVDLTFQDSLALQPDGKILIGQVRTVRRLLTSGIPDPAFTTPTLNGHVSSVAVLPDGKILIGGGFTAANEEARGRVLRLNPDGTVDPSFNAAPGLTSDDSVYVVAAAPGGKVYVGGYFNNINGVARSHLARLNPDGTLDPGFNPPSRSNVYAMAVQPDGKVIAGGFNTNDLHRYNTDGSLDLDFYGGQSPTSGTTLAVALRPDGKVFVGGHFSNVQGVPRGRVALLNADGSLDTSFDPGTSLDSTPVTMDLQPDGKLIIGGGFGVVGGTVRRRLARLNTDGSLDTSFASAFAESDTVYSARVQPDGKVVAAGSFTALEPDIKRVQGDLFATWADGDAADKTIQLPIVNDLLDEPDETLQLQLSLSGGATAGAIPAATLNILDDDAPPQFTSAAPARAIAGRPYSHTFQASGSPAPTFAHTGGALPPGMFLTPAGLLAGTTSSPGTYANISVTASNGVAPSATQTFDLVVASGGALQFSAGSYSVSENAGTATITVNRVNGSAGTATVNFAATGNTPSPGSDFTLPSGTLTFEEGETVKTLTMTVVNDDVNERDETVNLILNTAGGTGSVGSPSVATMTIVNDDPLPSIAVDDVTVTEGDGGTRLATFTVTRTGLTDRAVSFNARTADGTADSVEDYSPLNSIFQIAPAVTSTAVSVAVYGDTIVETDKTFALLLSSPSNTAIARARGACVIKDNDTTAGPPTVQFNAREFKASEGAGVVAVTVTRSGDSSSPAAVGYSTFTLSGSGVASDRRDYTPALGTLRFAAGETTKTFGVFVADDAYVEGDEFLQVVLSAPTGGAALGTPSGSLVRVLDNDAAAGQLNPADDTSFFVRQHYRDFLNRDADDSGLRFWTGEIDQCGADAACREVKRVNVSAAFFLSIEFQETGFLAFLLHKAAFNSGERLAPRTFLTDTSAIGEGVVVGATGWENRLEANRQAFLDGFVQRTQFLTAYPQTLTAAQFVDALNANTGDPLNPTAGGSLTQAERDRLVADLATGAGTRAQVLRAVAENREFRRRQFTKAFVLMQYLGYLRRAPNETPDTNFDGYNFWLSKLNEFGGNYINAEMVKAFISSDEYRRRFGP